MQLEIQHLLAVPTQEHQLASGASRGEALPGDSTQQWLVEKLALGAELVLGEQTQCRSS